MGKVRKVFYKIFRKNKREYNISKLKHREQCKSCRGAVVLPHQSLRQPSLESLQGGPLAGISELGF